MSFSTPKPTHNVSVEIQETLIEKGLKSRQSCPNIQANTTFSQKQEKTKHSNSSISLNLNSPTEKRPLNQTKELNFGSDSSTILGVFDIKIVIKTPNGRKLTQFV